MTETRANCAECPFKNADKRCVSVEGRHPDDCPTRLQEDVIAKAMHEYLKPEVREFALQASLQEAEGYADRERGYEHVRPVKPRILEIAEFARRMQYARLGLIFCAGLAKEGRAAAAYYRAKGFEVVSVLCKVGCVPKETLGVQDGQKIAVGRPESMCNPITQAMIANEARTQLNILLGLCVGHDSLVLKYCEAPCTVLAVKDRLLGHNPLAAVYTMDSYSRYLK
jgi:uncharacterized metal-binding protein